MKLSTALENREKVELRCGQCAINQEHSVDPYLPNPLGTLQLVGGHTLVFTEYQRVAKDGSEDPRYPISYQPLKDDPEPQGWLLLGAHRRREANLVNAGLAATSTYHYYQTHPTRRVQRAVTNGIRTHCRRGHGLAVTPEELEAMLDQEPLYPRGTYLPPVR